MARYSFVTKDNYGRFFRQSIDSSQNTVVVLSAHHPKKGTIVNTTLFVEALFAYVERRKFLLSTLKSFSYASCELPSNYIDVDEVLEIYSDLIAHEFEKIERIIMEAFYG